MSLVPTSGGAHKSTIRSESELQCGHSKCSVQPMGAAPSGVATVEASDCKLPETGLRFSAAQIERAEHLLVEDIRNASSETLADDELVEVGPEASGDADAERLLQRLLCSLASEDPRFRCKFLVCLGRRSRCAEYLIRLDSLSSPPLYDSDDLPACVLEEGVEGETLPQGYARVRIRSVAAAEEWAEFLCPAGFLRRDKVQERFVELLATAVANVTSTTATKNEDVDESRLCGVAGKVIDADILPELLSTQTDSQLFAGSASTTSLRQESIAIVEGCPWVRLHIGGVQVKLALGVTTERWPRGSTLPSRVSLTHPDCLLVQHACVSGCAAVAAGPPLSSSFGPGSRSTSWQIWLPAAAAIFKNHYAPRAAPRRAERALVAVRAITRLRTVSRHALRTLLWWRLEETPSVDWTPKAATRHTLILLDLLVAALRQRRLTCYFFPAVNVLVGSPRGTWRPAEQLDDADYTWDADAIEGYLRRLLHASSGTFGPQNNLSCWPGEEPATSWQLMEEALAPKWSVAVQTVTHGAPTRSRRLAIRAVRRHRTFGGIVTGSQMGSEAFLAPLQLDYVIAVMRGLLHARSLLLEGPPTKPWFPGGSSDSPDTSDMDDDFQIPWASPAGDVACVVAAALQQARAQALAEMSSATKRNTTTKHRRSSAGRRALRHFDHAARQLMDAVRRERTSNVATDDRTLVRGALRWLQCAQDRAPRALAAPLRHWLRGLTATTSSASWFLPQWTSTRRRNRDEIAALGATLRVITSGGATPAAAIADAERKGWTWAARLACMPPGTQGVAAPTPGKVVRFPVSAPLLTATADRRARRKTLATSSGSATLPASVAREFSVLLSNGFRPESDLVGDVRPVHCRLREASPSSSLLAARRRLGLLRGIGDIAPALLRMQKFGLVHEAVCSGPLSQDQQAEILAALQTATRESRKLVAAARRRTKERACPQEIYRPKSALIIEAPIAKVNLCSPPTPDADARLEAELRRLSIADSLMSAVRARRSSTLFVERILVARGSLTDATADKDHLTDDNPLPNTDLSFLELADDKTLRLGKVREGITKL